MKEKPWFPVVFMFAVSVFFSSILIGLAHVTRQRVEMNVQLNFERAVIEAFPEIQYKTDQEIHRIFTEQFEKDEKTGVYLYKKDGQLQGYAIPFAGQGFWDKIKGVIGIAADRQTIRGVAFYEQNETPGLGARIDEETFRRQFIEKKIAIDKEKLIGIVPVAETPGQNEVHAITGATQTCTRLEKLINDDIRVWLEAQEKEKVQP